MKQKSVKKNNGGVYTPDYIVKPILDLSGYNGKTILKKHVIDNSCGDGAFLVEIVRRYCETAAEANISCEELTRDLKTYIHGIELIFEECCKCRCRVSETATAFGVEINADEWDIVCADALAVHKFDGKMDFVIGNPPYVRIHNLSNSLADVKKFTFAQSGMTDLFIVFYEIGLRMLADNGVLGYITPSSFFSSVAGSYMRQFLVSNILIKKVVDLKHTQVFDATTYTTIVVLQKNRKHNAVDYYCFDEKKQSPEFVETLSSDDYYISGNFYFSSKNNLEILKKIYYNTGQSDIKVKNGYATLCDPVFIRNIEFESPFAIPVVKASKGIMQKIIFPYDKNARLLSEDVIRQDQTLYQYLTDSKDALLKRNNEKDAEAYWYAFGRSQALADTYKNKLAINTLIRDENDLKLVAAPQGTGVYSGLYIISDTIPIKDVAAKLCSKEFATYVALLAKYKSGGYYTFSSKDVKNFLDYQFSFNEGLFKYE